MTFVLLSREWRANVAHSLNKVDPISKVPLAVRVCLGDASLGEAYAQANTFEDIIKYGRTSGPVLTALCCLMWLVTVLSEMASCTRVTVAALQLHGGTTQIVEGRIQSISTIRLVVFVATQTLRIGIAAALAYGGIRFLTNTVQLDEIVLNAVALEERGVINVCMWLCMQCEHANALEELDCDGPF